MSPAPLPEVVYREFIDMLFGMMLPMVAMGIIVVAVAALVAWQWGDPVVAILAVTAALVTTVRVIVIAAYRRARDTRVDIVQVERWEKRYALGNYAFALTLGALNCRVLMFHDPLVHMLTVSLVFGFGAGLVSRISIRPVICVRSLLLVAVPTTIGFFLHSLTADESPLHAELFAIEAVLVATTTILSLHSVRYLYLSMAEHLTAKHDMTFLAKRDALTKLPNRLLLREEFQKGAALMSRRTTRLALHLLDLDGFKPINDQHGHPAGDLVLQEVARRMLATVRAGDTVARLGGDEFVVLQVGIAQDGEAEMLARRLIRSLSAPYEINGEYLRISASVGIALAPEEGRDLDHLIACADGALYRSKAGGKGQLRFCGSGDRDIGRQAVA
ncbi:hypothetical protein GCM10009087_25820 [Sphingomonas oligophenolica]|uniref:GGDEF domain-containing protein n=1 Tax=Sphingomonas oligophenolica TaxID=301154 RepID=A0ABU9Y887_9SPHN